MERKNKPAPPVSSERDDETRAALVLLLRQVGWDSAKDPDHARLTAALPSLRALLAPPALSGGGNAYPVDMQQAHVMAVAATQSMPKGPEQELAYTLAMARAMAGMTLRDYFAINERVPFDASEGSGLSLKTMQLLMPEQDMPPLTGMSMEWMVWEAMAVARWRYLRADAMVAERERRSA